MANNDEAGGSGGKAFWKLSLEMEEQPHLYEDAAFPTDPETTDGTALARVHSSEHRLDQHRELEAS